MDTADKAEKVTAPKRATKKPDPTTPLGEYLADEAQKTKERKAQNQVVEKYYELHGNKLLLCKRVSQGSIFRTLIGSTADKKTGAEVQAFVKKLQAENRLKVRV
jgi:hypothetical protein